MGERRSIARSARLELDEAVAATQRAERKLQQLPLASKGSAAASVGPRWDERLRAELRAQPALAEALQERLRSEPALQGAAAAPHVASWPSALAWYATEHRQP